MAEFTLLECIREVTVCNVYIDLKDCRSCHDLDITTPHTRMFAWSNSELSEIPSQFSDAFTRDKIRYDFTKSKVAVLVSCNYRNRQFPSPRIVSVSQGWYL